MTTVSFTPTVLTNLSFQATLDGAAYNCTITWNVDRVDWYINVFDQTNTRILSRAFVGSPPPPQAGINLVAPWFRTSTMYYYPPTATIVVLP